MCYFIAIAVPQDAADGVGRNIPQGLHVQPVDNPALTRVFGPDRATFIVTSGHCACDLFHAAAARPRGEQLRRKYERKGWSKAKVDRAIESALAGEGRWGHSVGFRPDVRHWLASLPETVAEVAVVLHWFHGDLATEQFGASVGPTLTPEAFELRAVVAEDEVVTIRK